MYAITLSGTPVERGLAQGRAYSQQMRELLALCPTWLGAMKPDRVAILRDRMVEALLELCPEMVEELHGLAAGSALPFEDVCLLNFVSAIGALKGCSNLIVTAPQGTQGPILAKTSDIGEDYAYYVLQTVAPAGGLPYLAVSWLGCLWAEVGINAAGLACGQGSAPTLPGQQGYGIPTLEYPRPILERCRTVDEAVEFCFETPMAGKGLNIALLDATGAAAVVEKSASQTAVRRTWRTPPPGSGAQVAGLFCTNHFLDPAFQATVPLSIAGIPELTMNSHQRLENLERFLDRQPDPDLGQIVSLLTAGIEQGGLNQQRYRELTTHYIYLVLPAAREMRVGRNESDGRVTWVTYRLEGAATLWKEGTD